MNGAQIAEETGRLIAKLAESPAEKTLVLGVGDPFRCHAEPGTLVLGGLRGRVSVATMECCGSLEQYDRGIIGLHPDFLFVIDAADWGAATGCFRLIEQREIDEGTVKTRCVPLLPLLMFLRQAPVKQTHLIGVQCSLHGFMSGVTPEVKIAACRIADIMAEHLT